MVGLHIYGHGFCNGLLLVLKVGVFSSIVRMISSLLRRVQV